MWRKQLIKREQWRCKVPFGKKGGFETQIFGAAWQDRCRFKSRPLTMEKIRMLSKSPQSVK